MRIWLIGALLTAAAGCHSNPYCLNCKDSGNGVLNPIDMTPPPDLYGVAPPGDGFGSSGGGDMPNSNGCTPTNGGVEICDGIDNDCDGVVDNVKPDKLIDPNNCGACGKVCKYPNAFGVCAAGPPPTCNMGDCQPGHVDLNHDPTDGCEYACVVSNNGVEICDGKDNNCDGYVDEKFTTTWLDPQHQMPAYDGDTFNCGSCGAVCSYGPGTNVACPIGPNHVGQCTVTGCVNALDKDGVQQTYRHDPSAGPLATTGCEYHCPRHAHEIDKSCLDDGACTFDPEICDGVDDNCNFKSEIETDPAKFEAATDADIGTTCRDGKYPGKLCSDAAGNCVGACKAGSVACINGSLQCTGSVGPSPEGPLVPSSCDKIDNDCDGKVDNGFTNTWADANNQVPRYDSSAANCGACGTVCSLPNAINGCNLKSGDTKGSCYVVSCNPSWFEVSHKDSDPTKPTCDVTISGKPDSTQTSTGYGCNYQCNVSPQSPEVCDGKDNDCDGCIDNGLTAPSICSTKGVCGAPQTLPNFAPTTICAGDKGYKCDYSGVKDVSIVDRFTLSATEQQCDNQDNNCNGPCDENFPDVPVSGAGCTNSGRPVQNCTAGKGACQTSGPFTCQKSGAVAYNDIEACSAQADNTKASNEVCNGKDDDCNGLIDEPTTNTIGGKTFQGWHDPMVLVQVPAFPATGQNPCTDAPAQCGAHPVYVYQYEASRPDSSGTGIGALSTRACANSGVLPWSNVTYQQAQAACQSIKDGNGNSIGRLCTAWEWQQTCDALATSGDHWSMSTTPTSYSSGICNDGNEGEQRCTAATQCIKTCNGSGQCTCASNADCNPGFTCNGTICVGSGAWPTGVTGTSSAGGNVCSVTVGGGQARDMTGNLMEWTSTPVVLKSGNPTDGTGATIALGPATGQLKVTGLSGILPTNVGAQLVIANANSAGDNGTWDIVAFVDGTSVIINVPGGSASTGTATWQLIYRKLRGGAFSTQQPSGLTCEFDFDIQKASFANTDLGFRCCSDSPP
jgi:formylglycine-generating enzyme required for sulfatase activity